MPRLARFDFVQHFIKEFPPKPQRSIMPRQSTWRATQGGDYVINTGKDARVFEPRSVRLQPRDGNDKNSTRQCGLRNEETAWLKYLSLLGLLLTTTISTVVLIGLEKGWKITGQTYHTITSSRATTQFIISIFSNFLGGILVTVFCQLFNRATRLALSRPTSLDRLAFWHAVSTKNLKWDLPTSFLSLLVAFYLASAGYV